MTKSLAALLLLAACGAAPRPVATPTTTPTPTTAASTESFSVKVRQDFFDGLRGDAAAMARAMTACEHALAADPNNAEAMVWHGAGLAASSSAKFATGDQQGGLALYERGTGEMDHAVELAPRSVAVRIPRGAAMLGMAPFVPDPERTKLLQRGVADYEATLDVQQPYFKTLTLHAREQLLYGLTDGYANLGDLPKARGAFELMQRDAAGSELLARAKTRAEGGTVAGRTPCEQCHAR